MKPFAVLTAVLAAALVCSAQEKQLGEKDVKDLQKIVEDIRGLKFKHAVKVGVQDEKDLRAMLEKNFDEEFPVAKAERVEAAYKKLGLIPQDMELRSFMIDLMADSIGGYYDPKTKQLNLIRRTGADGNKMNEMMKQLYGVSWDTMATIHELTHALQDQHFDLQTIPTDMEGNDDQVSAMQSVFEGEANFVMYEHVSSKRGMSLRSLPSLRMFLAGGASGSPKMNAAPEILKRDLAFPYMEGMVFVHAVLVKGEKWDAVEKLYDALPLSTEQVLHPEKYLEPDYPMLVKLPDLSGVLGKGWEKIEENALGELNTQVLLGEFISRKKYRKTIDTAAAGWDGDRFAVYRKGDKTTLAWLSTWDSEEDAQQFEKAAKRALRKKLGADGEEDDKGRMTWDGGSAVERVGSDVLWIETAGPALDKVAKAVWAGFELKEIRKVERKKPETKVTAAVETDHFLLKVAPRKVAWKVVEEGNDATITWKGLDGALTFRCVTKKGRDAAKALEAALESAREELSDAKRGKFAIEGVDAPSAMLSGTSDDLGDVRIGIVVLEARKRWVVARLACSEGDWAKALKQFERVVKGFEAK